MEWPSFLGGPHESAPHKMTSPPLTSQHRQTHRPCSMWRVAIGCIYMMHAMQPEHEYFHKAVTHMQFQLSLETKWSTDNTKQITSKFGLKKIITLVSVQQSNSRQMSLSIMTRDEPEARTRISVFLPQLIVEERVKHMSPVSLVFSQHFIEHIPRQF